MHLVGICSFLLLLLLEPWREKRSRRLELENLVCSRMAKKKVVQGRGRTVDLAVNFRLDQLLTAARNNHYATQTDEFQEGMLNLNIDL